VDPAMVQVLRNGIETDKFQPVPPRQQCQAGDRHHRSAERPQRELCYRLLDEVLDLDACQVRSSAAPRCRRVSSVFRSKVDFVGYVDDVPCPDGAMRSGDRGRSGGDGGPAVRPSGFAIGEAKAIGLVTEQNLDEALASNFGDIGPRIWRSILPH
jgi:hypothetical protein